MKTIFCIAMLLMAILFYSCENVERNPPLMVNNPDQSAITFKGEKIFVNTDRVMTKGDRAFVPLQVEDGQDECGCEVAPFITRHADFILNLLNTLELKTGRVVEDWELERVGRRSVQGIEGIWVKYAPLSEPVDTLSLLSRYRHYEVVIPPGGSLMKNLAMREKDALTFAEKHKLRHWYDDDGRLIVLVHPGQKYAWQWAPIE